MTSCRCFVVEVVVVIIILAVAIISNCAFLPFCYVLFSFDTVVLFLQCLPVIAL
jgi:hypothetical protein